MEKVLITGATGGIGQKIAEALAEKKYELILLSRNINDLNILKQNLVEKNNCNVQVIASDVSNYEDLKIKLNVINEIDVIINCAGILGPVGPFGENNISEWARTIQINLMGTINVCSILLDKLQKSKHGKIINFSGGGGAFPRKNHTAYATSKAAIVRFTENLSVEYPNIDVNAIAPGAHKTKIWATETFDKEPDKWADPVRLQELIIYLCSPESNGVTGRFLHICDDWDKREYKTLGKDYYTLRRIDEQLLKKLNQ